MFPEFDVGATTNYKEVWQDAIFVFDTNVLLNLYRYQSATRDQLLTVLGKLSNRIWIPHHVALEFQRNRLSVLADQNKRFTEVRSAISKAQSSLDSDLRKLQLERRHSLIDPAPVTTGFKEITTKFLRELDEIQEKQQKLTGPDTLKDQVEALFEGRVGSAPKDQAGLDALNRSAEGRYAIQIPPGYMDDVKDRKGPDEHVSGGITYKRKYGDFVVWSQLLEHAKENEIKTLVFVTDDAKVDWWWVVDMDGPKTLGPRPELVEEAKRVGGIDAFHMFRPEGFLAHSEEALKTGVSKEALDEVRDLSRIRANLGSKHRRSGFDLSIAESAVFDWLGKSFSHVVRVRAAYPDFVVNDQGQRIGLEVYANESVRLRTSRIREKFYKAHYEMAKGRLEGLMLVWIAQDKVDAEFMIERLKRLLASEISSNIRNIVGVVLGEAADGAEFVPIGEVGPTSESGLLVDIPEA